MAASKPTGPSPATRQRRPNIQSGVVAASGQRTICRRIASSMAFSTMESGSSKTPTGFQIRPVHEPRHSLLIDHEFRLIAVYSLDASLAVLAGLAHIGATHLADGEHSPHPRLTVNTAKSPIFTRVTEEPMPDDLAKHLMADHEFLLTGGGVSTSSGHLLPGRCRRCPRV